MYKELVPDDNLFKLSTLVTDAAAVLSPLVIGDGVNATLVPALKKFVASPATPVTGRLKKRYFN